MRRVLGDLTNATPGRQQSAFAEPAAASQQAVPTAQSRAQLWAPDGVEHRAGQGWQQLEAERLQRETAAARARARDAILPWATRRLPPQVRDINIMRLVKLCPLALWDVVNQPLKQSESVRQCLAMTAALNLRGMTFHVPPLHSFNLCRGRFIGPELPAVPFVQDLSLQQLAQRSAAAREQEVVPPCPPLPPLPASPTRAGAAETVPPHRSQLRELQQELCMDCGQCIGNRQRCCWCATTPASARLGC